MKNKWLENFKKGGYIAMSVMALSSPINAQTTAPQSGGIIFLEGSQEQTINIARALNQAFPDSRVVVSSQNSTERQRENATAFLEGKNPAQNVLEGDRVGRANFIATFEGMETDKASNCVVYTPSTREIEAAQRFGINGNVYSMFETTRLITSCIRATQGGLDSQRNLAHSNELYSRHFAASLIAQTGPVANRSQIRSSLERIALMEDAKLIESRDISAQSGDAIRAGISSSANNIVSRERAAMMYGARNSLSREEIASQNRSLNTSSPEIIRANIALENLRTPPQPTPTISLRTEGLLILRGIEEQLPENLKPVARAISTQRNADLPFLMQGMQRISASVSKESREEINNWSKRVVESRNIDRSR